MLSDAVATVLDKQSTEQALRARSKAQKTAQLDAERDVEEEQDVAQQDAMELNVAHGTPEQRLLNSCLVADVETLHFSYNLRQIS